MQWTVYYADGSTFSSDDGPPEKAPKDYVQTIAQKTKDGRDLIDGMGTSYEFYCWHPEYDCWIIHNQSGLDQFLAKNKDGVYLRGYYISDEAFRKIHLMALDDPAWKDLPASMVRASEWTG